MAGSTVKIGVDVTQFKQGMQQAQQSAKTLQTQMKANEAQFKATGDKEQYLTEKGKLLRAQLEEQRKAADNAKKALAAMDKEGVEPTSREYQQMERALAGANAAMYETQAAMNAVTVSEGKAAGGASNLEKSLSSISRNVSLDTVTKGIEGISSAMEKAGKKAVELGKQIWSNIMDSAEYADNIATLATRTGLSIDEIQRMEYVADRFEAPVEQMAKTWKKVKMNMSSDSDEVAAAFDRLGVSTQIFTQGKNGPVVTGMRDYMDVFWETGEAIMRMTDASEQERIAQLLLGRSWDEMTTLFGEGREKYEAAMEGATVADEEAVQQAADLNDRMNELEKQWDTLKLQAIGELAPALKTAADAIGTLLDRLTTYLKSDDGQKQLQRISEALGKIFGNLSEINPDDVVGKFAGVMEKIQEAFAWIGDNWDKVETGLKAIGAAFGLIKIAQFATNLTKVVNGFKTLWQGANKPLPTLPGTDSGTPTGTGAETAGKTSLGAKVGAAFADAAGMSLSGALIGTAATGLIIYAGTEAINNINRAAEKEREVEADPYRFSGGIGGPMGDKRLVLQDTVRRLFATTGETGGIMGPEWQLKWLSQNLNNQIMEAFSYAGGSKNKLIDMLNMDPQNAAAAYQMLRWAGFDRPGSDWSKEWRDAYETGRGSYAQIKDAGAGLGYEWALTTIRDYFGNSGTFNENGEWTIPGLEEDLAAQREAAQAMNGAAESMATLPEKVAAAVSAAPIRVELGFGLPKANGIWSVPWDGYPAILHKGERVMTARENQQYTYNTYFGNVNLNNGLEIEALTESIDRRNRRQRSGYGS